MRERTGLDRVLSAVRMSFLSIPVFVTAVLLLVGFVVHLGWFPRLRRGAVT